MSERDAWEDGYSEGYNDAESRCDRDTSANPYPVPTTWELQPEPIPSLVRVLLAVEWCGQRYEDWMGPGDDPTPICPWPTCNATKGEGHAPGCPRQAALRKAGVDV